GLHNEFGAERSFDVPLAEDAMTGVGIGAALLGMRPIQVHQRMDFVLLCMNQIVNMAAKMSYMFAGAHHVPLVIRAIIGRSSGQDITIVGISHMALECVRAKHLLLDAGVDAEVVDPVSLSPLDGEGIARSVERTGRLLVVDTGWLSCGASSEVLSAVFERIGHKRPFLGRRLG